MRNTSDGQASICRWLIEAIHFQDFIRLVHVEALGQCDLFCSPIQSLDVGSVAETAFASALCSLMRLSEPHIIHSTLFYTVRLQPVQVRANVLRKKTLSSSVKRNSSTWRRAALMLIAKAWRSSSLTRSVFSLLCFTSNFGFKQGQRFFSSLLEKGFLYKPRLKYTGKLQQLQECADF